MLWRLAFPLVLMFVPRLIPSLARTVSLVWKLIFDNRVPLLLRLLVPATLVYFVTPLARVPLVGPAGYVLVLLLAVSILLNLAPRDVVEGYAPWRVKQRTAERGERGPARVVEGSGRLVDEDEPSK